MQQNSLSNDKASEPPDLCQEERKGAPAISERSVRIGQDLLAWYDREARVLPWRIPPGSAAMPDPYHVWLSEVMLQQTTVAAVRGYFLAFLARWPRVEDLAAAPDAEVMAAWAGLGYYARARNLLACARTVVSEHGGRFPDTEEALAALPGIGAYTAAAIAAIAFDRSAVVVDGNVERVVAQLCAVETPLPAAKPVLRALASVLTPDRRPGDHAQAMMDLGATICTPRRPACAICPLLDPCEARRAGIAELLPRKAEKVAKPVRSGIVYLGVAPDGGVFVETRPKSGLLGGMIGLPGGPWVEGTAVAQPPFEAKWRDLGVEVLHTFTHFHLRLAILGALVPPEGGRFMEPGRAMAAMPTVMRKALRAGLEAMRPRA